MSEIQERKKLKGIDIKLQEAKNAKQELINEINELSVQMRVKENQSFMIDSFIDVLEDLKRESEEE